MSAPLKIIALFQLANPEVLRAMSNPRVLEAFQQIQHATAVIRQEAPSLMKSAFFEFQHLQKK